MKKYIIPYVNMLLGQVLVLTPSFLFSVCYSGSYMDCWSAGFFIMIMGISVEMLSLYALYCPYSCVFNFLSSLAALMSILVPYRVIAVRTFRLCDDASHACRTSTMPAVIVIASLIIILNIADIFIRCKARFRNSHLHSRS
ncbi:MAG: DUF4418 family protein [Synergistaceae bacterium]|nr:DUF4418 family protein [Synergistaceae bacterium]MBQ3450368.1 DUF4418 family protein [Synergistaceae bacterium]MBQ3694230.1 DUF4418 family protein [Synergistaceae bacterium]MBQ6111821.1 DUF4418 family protein [Synergistaceae bacterium]MBR0069081.1 DUF4418 family protein [Synergistaceae bacterium]